VIVRQFRGCQVWVWPETQFLRTVYPSGATVPAAPEDTAAYRATATGAGYGGDTWRLCLEHEQAHTLLAEARGLPYSPTLWAQAHGEPLPRGLIPAEECVVLAFQAWCNGDADALDVLEMYGWTGPELARLRAQLREE
jgi:hypothetical protein